MIEAALALGSCHGRVEGSKHRPSQHGVQIQQQRVESLPVRALALYHQRKPAQGR